jgi:glutathione synthase/RimK-type ligase-like ATP-grasp enzyme
VQKILILAEPGDVHAIAVAEGLTRKGGLPILWCTSDFPSRASETIAYETGRRELRVQAPEAEFTDTEIGAVWRRRPAYVLDPAWLHPADFRFAENECRIFRRALYELLAPGAFWVNRPGAAVLAGYKMVQHEAARRVGLMMPDTLYTNDPDLVREFIRRHGGRIVYKPFSMTAWQDEETIWMPYTSLLEEHQLVADETLRLTPGIYQALVPKKHEMRITIMGRRLFPVQIRSQETSAGRLDWRKAYDELRMEPCEVPEEVSTKCLALMSSLGIVFGCFDFVITPRGEYVFLEVNEAGQFLFVERYAGVPLLDAFCEFLLQARPEFEWDERRVAVRYEAIEDLALDRSKAMSTAHVAPLDRAESEMTADSASRAPDAGACRRPKASLPVPPSGRVAPTSAAGNGPGRGGGSGGRGRQGRREPARR